MKVLHWHPLVQNTPKMAICRVVPVSCVSLRFDSPESCELFFPLQSPGSPRSGNPREKMGKRLQHSPPGPTPENGEKLRGFPPRGLPGLCKGKNNSQPERAFPQSSLKRFYWVLRCPDRRRFQIQPAVAIWNRCDLKSLRFQLRFRRYFSALRPSRVNFAWTFPFFTPFLTWNFGEIVRRTP